MSEVDYMAFMRAAESNHKVMNYGDLLKVIDGSRNCIINGSGKHVLGWIHSPHLRAYGLVFCCDVYDALSAQERRFNSGHIIDMNLPPWVKIYIDTKGCIAPVIGYSFAGHGNALITLTTAK